MIAPRIARCFVALLLLVAAGQAQDRLEGSADPRCIVNGVPIPSEGYCDQPYVVVDDEGAWVCVLTTGPGDEGDLRQHVVSTRSRDHGETWSELVDIEPPGPPEASWAMPLKAPSGRIYVFDIYNADNLREVEASTDYARRRVDTLGRLVFKYSDDVGGHRLPNHRLGIVTKQTIKVAIVAG